ncbi:tetratricopeptide repeat protein [Nannocystis pusilla]|uniref:tetratricopeptide repeat protein n=1 Tax=Nannocystis pusilla TaxID=889268 RepID=UPI003B7E3069
MSEQTCLPDPRGRCIDPVPRVAPGEMTAGDREWLAAYDAFLAEPGLQGTPEAGQVAVERAELLMRYRRWDEAETSLRAVSGPAREQARVLLVGLLLARWMEAASAGERSAARVALVTVAVEVEAAGGPQVAQVAALRRAALWAQAEESEAVGDDARCGAAFEGLYADLGADIHAAAEAADGAGRCYERAGLTQKAIDWLERMADVHREDPRAPDAVLRLARLHERILNDEQARDRYLDLVARAPRHRAAATAAAAR